MVCQAEFNFRLDLGPLITVRYKMSWFEGSARVPLLISYPKRFASKTITENVSTLDVLPTLVELVGGSLDTRLPMDGKSLLPLLNGSWCDPETILGEYAGEGTIAPIMMMRCGPWKFVICPADPPQLYNLRTDPRELCNLASSEDKEIKTLLEAFITKAHQRWDFKKIHEDVLHSQRSRRLCWGALTQGRFESWDYQPEDQARTK